MIGYVKGTLEEMEENAVVLDVNGFGVRILVSDGFLYEMPSFGTEMKIYTYTYVKEDAFSLYGFRDREELALFKKLITVSGIGPKGGLAILSAFSPDELRFAIYSGDVKTISKAPGIGKKTAERLVLELKDKVDLEQMPAQNLLGEIEGGQNRSSMNAGVCKEAIEALTALGYSATDASRAVKQVSLSEGMTVEEILMAALRFM